MPEQKLPNEFALADLADEIVPVADPDAEITDVQSRIERALQTLNHKVMNDPTKHCLMGGLASAGRYLTDATDGNLPFNEPALEYDIDAETDIGEIQAWLVEGLKMSLDDHYSGEGDVERAVVETLLLFDRLQECKTTVELSEYTEEMGGMEITLPQGDIRLRREAA